MNKPERTLASNVPVASAGAFAVVAALLLAPAPVQALSEMSEHELSAVNAQDGLEVSIATNTITADRLRLDIDNPNGSYPGYNAYLDLEDITLTGVNSDGTTTGLATTFTSTFDVGAVSQSTLPAMAFQSSWTRTRFMAEAIRHQSDSGKSFGSTAFDSSGSLSIINTGGPFNGASNEAYLNAQITDGEWYYRQNGNEFIWDNLNANIGYSGGTLSLDASGITFTATRFDWDVQWDIGYRSSPAVAMSSAADVVPYLHYGWAGGLRNVQATIRGGGVWVGPVTSRTQGVNISWRADADTDFEWIIGDAGSAPAVLYFQDWVNLPGATAGLNIPNLTLDVINANQGPGGFLYRGTDTDTLYSMPPDAGALAVVMRDTSFLTYNTKVRLVDTTIARDQVYDWALIYTLGDVDLNLFAYPGGKPSVNAAEGLRFDLALGVQSPGPNWTKNSHFLIGDTDVGSNVAVGFVNTNFLINIDNGYLTLLSSGLELETQTDFRWRLGAIFGGGILTDLTTPVRMFDLDLDLHASGINVKFNPPPCPLSVCATYMSYQWDARLYQSNAADPSTADSSIAISEPSRPNVKLVFGEIGGDVQVRNGVIDLRAGTETPADNETRLAFEQNLRFGLSATNPSFYSGNNRPLYINDVALGTIKIGAMVLPGGNWYGGFALKEQL